MYVLKLSLKPWKINPFNQFLTSLSVGFLLFSCGMLFWIERGLRPVLHRIKSEQVITAYLNPSLEKAGEDKLVDTVKTLIGSRPAEIEFVNTEEFLNRLKEPYPDLSQEIEKLGADKEKLLPRYLSVSGILPTSIFEKIRTTPGIDSAESSANRYPHVFSAFQALRRMTQLLMAGLCLALFILLIQLARLNANVQHDSLSLLRLMGAKFFSQRLPSLLSGLWSGLLGGILASTAWILSSSLLADRFQTLSPWLKQIPPPPMEIGIALLLFGILFGLFAGAFAQK